MACTGTLYTTPVARLIFDFYNDDAKVKVKGGNDCYDSLLD